jgi:hypothetical protein
MKRYTTRSDINLAVDTLKADGGFVLEGLIEAHEVDQMNEFLDDKGSTYKQLYFEENWGFGNVMAEPTFSSIIENTWVSKLAQARFSCSFSHNHLVCNEKAPFVGYEVEWHQEVFNINTFAPGCPPAMAEDFFIQAFIALDEQGPSNGGLMVMPQSNKLGVLDSIDVLSPALTHKKSVTVDDLKRADVNGGVMCPELRPGDALIFSPLLVHGSVRNFSEKRRRSLVLQLTSNSVPDRNEEVYEREVEYRKDFATINLQYQIDKLTGSNLYDGLKKVVKNG